MKTVILFLSLFLLFANVSFAECSYHKEGKQSLCVGKPMIDYSDDNGDVVRITQLLPRLEKARVVVLTGQAMGREIFIEFKDLGNITQIDKGLRVGDTKLDYSDENGDLVQILQLLPRLQKARVLVVTGQAEGREIFIDYENLGKVTNRDGKFFVGQKRVDYSDENGDIVEILQVLPKFQRARVLVLTGQAEGREIFIDYSNLGKITNCVKNHNSYEDVWGHHGKHGK